jgi:hypothetical protein
LRVIKKKKNMCVGRDRPVRVILLGAIHQSRPLAQIPALDIRVEVLGFRVSDLGKPTRIKSIHQSRPLS